MQVTRLGLELDQAHETAADHERRLAAERRGLEERARGLQSAQAQATESVSELQRRNATLKDINTELEGQLQALQALGPVRPDTTGEVARLSAALV